MPDTISFAQLLLAVSLAATVAVLSNRLSALARVPAPLFFLAGAAVAVTVVPQLTAPPEQTVERLVTVCLLCILFDGGMQIGRDRFQAAAVPILVVGVAGTFLTTAAVALLAHVEFGLSAYAAVLLGAVLAPTDPAVVFSVLGQREITLECRAKGGLDGTLGAVSSNFESAREAPSAGELLRRIADLPEDDAVKLLARIIVAPQAPEVVNDKVEAAAPRFRDWDEYVRVTTEVERKRWCAHKAKTANRGRLMSGRPSSRITGDDVWQVLKVASGRCAYCGSLAVESRPSRPDGAPVPWANVGRRIGSLGHVVGRFHGGSNSINNLCWCCLWCNTWQEERRLGATDHGGLQPA